MALTTLALEKLASTNGVAGKNSIHHMQNPLSYLRKHRAYRPKKIVSLASHSLADLLTHPVGLQVLARGGISYRCT